MTYIEGFITPVPVANRDAYIAHARKAAGFIREFGATRMVESWGDDVPKGEVTDFAKAVQAKDDEAVLFSWFEYPDKATREAANRKMMDDPRMGEMARDMPFDGSRMIYGGFASLLDEGGGQGGYVDGLVIPVPSDNKDAYKALAEKAAGKFREFGALRVVEGWGDDVPDGKVTDYRRAVQAKDGETVVYSFIEWPDKETRDKGWGRMMSDSDAQPKDMPFDGKRMFWGGFRPILEA